MSFNPAFVAELPWTFDKTPDVFYVTTSLCASFPISSRVGEDDEFLQVLMGPLGNSRKNLKVN